MDVINIIYVYIAPFLGTYRGTSFEKNPFFFFFLLIEGLFYYYTYTGNHTASSDSQKGSQWVVSKYRNIVYKC